MDLTKNLKKYLFTEIMRIQPLKTGRHGVVVSSPSSYSRRSQIRISARRLTTLTCGFWFSSVQVNVCISNSVYAMTASFHSSNIRCLNSIKFMSYILFKFM